MPPLSPKQKQALSGLISALVGALLTWANQNLHLLPGAWAVIGTLVMTGVAHLVPTLGTKAVIEEKVDAKVAVKVAEIVESERL